MIWRKISFLSWEKTWRKIWDFSKNTFSCKETGFRWKLRLCWVQICHSFAHHEHCCGIVNANVQAIDILSRKIHLLEITLRFGSRSLWHSLHHRGMYFYSQRQWTRKRIDAHTRVSDILECRHVMVYCCGTQRLLTRVTIEGKHHASKTVDWKEPVT